VKLVALDENDVVQAVARVIPDDKEDADAVEGTEGDTPTGELALEGGGDA